MKYSNEKKLRQKFFRSDFKNKKIKEESILKYKNYNLTTGKIYMIKRILQYIQI